MESMDNIIDHAIDKMNDSPGVAFTKKLSTATKYFNALVDLQSKIHDHNFSMSRFCVDHKMSQRFGSACVQMGIIQETPTRSNRLKYVWTLDRVIIPQDADAIRRAVGIITNGRDPKFGRKGGGTMPTHTTPGESRRKPAKIDDSGHPRGFMSTDDVVKRIEGSFFNKLCPDCAETLRNLIDIISSKNKD